MLLAPLCVGVIQALWLELRAAKRKTITPDQPAKTRRYECFVSKEPDCLWYVHWYEPPDGRDVEKLMGPFNTKEEAEFIGRYNWRRHEYR